MRFFECWFERLHSGRPHNSVSTASTVWYTSQVKRVSQVLRPVRNVQSNLFWRYMPITLNSFYVHAYLKNGTIIACFSSSSAGRSTRINSAPVIAFARLPMLTTNYTLHIPLSIWKKNVLNFRQVCRHITVQVSLSNICQQTLNHHHGRRNRMHSCLGVTVWQVVVQLNKSKTLRTITYSP